MFGWLKSRLKRPEDRNDIEKLRGELSTNLSELDSRTDLLKQLMQNMIAERHKDAH